MRSVHHYTRALLALGLLGVVVAGQSSAALNCATQQCVEVATNNGQVGNNAWTPGMKSYLAYSTTYADTGYGQDSKGGTAGAKVMGFYRPVTSFTPDCTGITPVSGTATAYGSGTQNRTFTSKCEASK